MMFLVSISTPGFGEWRVGFICVVNAQAAQRNVVKKLVEAEVSIEEIQQDTATPTLFVRGSTINIIPISEFDGKKALTLVALL